MKKVTLFLLTTAICVSLTTAFAQDLNSIAQQNMAFDQQMMGQIQQGMAQNQMAQQQLMQSYIQQNGPRLQAEYQQYVASTGMQISFEQFVYSHMMTAGGTNPGPAIEAQRRQFEGLQQANKTVQEGYNSYNQGYYDNQRRLDATAQRYSNEAIQGNTYYQNPQTGEVFNMPYGAQPGGYQQGQNQFYNDQQGNYHQVDPQGYGQQMELANPNQVYGGGGWEDD